MALFIYHISVLGNIFSHYLTCFAFCLFDCFFFNYFKDSAAFVRIWKKGDLMLFTGTVQISREPSLARFKLDPMDNTTLVNLVCNIMNSLKIFLVLSEEIKSYF